MSSVFFIYFPTTPPRPICFSDTSSLSSISSPPGGGGGGADAAAGACAGAGAGAATA